MTKEELREYINLNGNQEEVVRQVRAMNSEGAPMTIEELDRRMKAVLESRTVIKQESPQAGEIPTINADPEPVKQEEVVIPKIPTEPSYMRETPHDTVVSETPSEKTRNGDMNAMSLVMAALMAIGYVIMSLGSMKMSADAVAEAQMYGTVSPTQMNPMVLVGLFLVCILSIVAQWKMFVKAGKPGWASIIPIYNVWVYFDIVWDSGAKMFLMLIPLFNIYYAIRTVIELGNRFGKGVGFKLGLVFFQPIFQTMLAFDNSDYR